MTRPVGETRKRHEVVYDPDMIRAFQEMLNALDVLAKKNNAFRNIQNALIQTAKRERMPIIRPDDGPVTPSIVPARTHETTSSSVARPRGTASSGTSMFTPSRPASETPLSREEHLAALRNLQEKLHVLEQYRNQMPESVWIALGQLYDQVQQSIQNLTQQSRDEEDVLASPPNHTPLSS